MRLRTKVTVIILATFGVMFALTVWNSRHVLINNYITLENHLALDQVNRVKGAIDQQLTGVETLTASFSAWDDAYHVFLAPLQDRQKYIESNMSLASFVASDIDLHLYFDPEGHFLFGK